MTSHSLKTCDHCIRRPVAGTTRTVAPERPRPQKASGGPRLPQEKQDPGDPRRAPGGPRDVPRTQKASEEPGSPTGPRRLQHVLGDPRKPQEAPVTGNQPRRLSFYRFFEFSTNRKSAKNRSCIEIVAFWAFVVFYLDFGISFLFKSHKLEKHVFLPGFIPSEGR